MDPTSSMGRAAATTLILVVLLVPALYLGWVTTRDLSWPPDVDLDRDIAQARTMADGELLADPFYRGETVWYNPLVPALIAGLSRLTGVAVNVLYTRAGAFLNLAAPLAFFVLLDRCFGRVAAVVATCHLLYLRDAGSPAWLSPSYSPWLWSASFTPALFYATVLAYRSALASASAPRFVLSGLLLGLTFLGHTAPALILGLAILVSVAGEGFARRGPHLRRHVVLVASAAAAASPFLWSIVVRYRLHIRNRVPLDWVWPPMRLGNLGSFVVDQCSLATVLALAALVGLAFRDPRRREARLLTAWALGAAGLLAYGILGDALPLPGLVPRHHFFFYWRAAESALVGYGAAVAVTRIAERRASWPGRRTAFVLVVGSALMIGLAWPSYRRRDAFGAERREAERDDLRANRQRAREWIETHSRLDDVFLAADDLALLVVGPTGRKTVAVDSYFANPYVDAKPRREGRDAMIGALERGDGPAFVAAAAPFSVTHVIRKKSDGPALDHVPGLVPEFVDARIRIYRVVTSLPSEP